MSLEEINRGKVPEDYLARIAATRPALRALALAMREHGNDAVERLYVAMGEAAHGRKEQLSDNAVVDACIQEAGLPADLRLRALADPSTEEYLVQRFTALAGRKAFGVPTIVFEGAAPIFGPVITEVPIGESAADLWDHFRSLATRSDFFELKRER